MVNTITVLDTVLEYRRVGSLAFCKFTTQFFQFDIIFKFCARVGVMNLSPGWGRTLIKRITRSGVMRFAYIYSTVADDLLSYLLGSLPAIASYGTLVFSVIEPQV